MSANNEGNKRMKGKASAIWMMEITKFELRENRLKLKIKQSFWNLWTKIKCAIPILSILEKKRPGKVKKPN